MYPVNEKQDRVTPDLDQELTDNFRIINSSIAGDLIVTENSNLNQERIGPSLQESSQEIIR